MTPQITQTLPTVLIYQSEYYDALPAYLKANGYAVVETTDTNVVSTMRISSYDICILDHYNAAELFSLQLVLTQRKLHANKPILFITATAGYEFMFTAFEAGVDDYLVRPVNLDEVLCRIKALLRRCKVNTHQIEAVYTLGYNCDFDTRINTIFMGDERVKLSQKENQILSILCAYVNDIAPLDVILEHAWNDNTEYNKRSLDVYMVKLRSLFKERNDISIRTIRGAGYSLVASQARVSDVDDLL